MVSGFRKDKKDGFKFAKDKKQVLMALFSSAMFILSLLYMINQINPGLLTSQKPDENNTSTDSFQMENSDLGQSSISTDELSPEAQEIYKKTQELKENLGVNEESSDMDSDIQILPSKPSKTRGKMISIVVDDSVNHENPFLPTMEQTYKRESKITYPVYITPPPLDSGVDIDANKIVETSVSGIMYDAFSPSAVVKIEGTDYLVKKNDIIKGYKVLDIKKDHVMFKYHKNIYSGYIGQLLVKSDLDFGKNISNLNSKFGGSSVTISVKRSTNRR